MLFDRWHDSWTPPLLTIRLIVLSLALGTLFFGAFVVWQSENQPPGPAAPEAPPPMVTYISLLAILATLAARIMVPRAVDAGGRREMKSSTGSGSDAADVADPAARRGAAWLALYMTRTIVAAALLEGVTFFVLIAYMLERQPIALAAAVALIVAVLAHCPTRGRVLDWMTAQERLLSEEQTFPGR